MQPEPQRVEPPQQVEQPEQLTYEMPGDDSQQPQPDQLKFVHESSAVGESVMHNESAMRRLEELPVGEQPPATEEMP